MSHSTGHDLQSLESLRSDDVRANFVHRSTFWPKSLIMLKKKACQMTSIIERLTSNPSDWKFLPMLISGIINLCNALGIPMADFTVKPGVRILPEWSSYWHINSIYMYWSLSYTVFKVCVTDYNSDKEDRPQYWFFIASNLLTLHTLWNIHYSYPISY